MYHVMNRGDQREVIFRDDEDRQRFLWTLGEARQKRETHDVGIGGGALATLAQRRDGTRIPVGSVLSQLQN